MPENPYQPPKEVKGAETGPAVPFDHAVWLIPVVLLIFAGLMAVGLWLLLVVG